MPILKIQGTDRVIGEISSTQLQFLIDQLEEEHTQDRDYYLDHDTLAVFEENGCDPQLLLLLRDALGNDESIDVEWTS